MGIFGILLAAIAVGAVAFVVFKIAKLTIGIIKQKIREILENSSGSIKMDSGAFISVKEILERAPTFSIDELGDDIEIDDFVAFGVKDNDMEGDGIIIRADEVDEQVQDLMKKSGGAIKVFA